MNDFFVVHSKRPTTQPLLIFLFTKPFMREKITLVKLRMRKPKALKAGHQTRARVVFIISKAS